MIDLPLHNGWRNYPTYSVQLWMTGGDESRYHMFQRVARRCYKEAVATATHTKTENAAFQFAAELKQHHKIDASSILGSQYEDSSVYADLLGWSLDLVDWREVAEAFIKGETTD